MTKTPESYALQSSLEEVYFQRSLYTRAMHTARLSQKNNEIQTKCQSLINGYQELVCLDSSLIPLESSRYLEDDEIVIITMGLVRKDICWNNLQFSEALHHLQSLQVHLFLIKKWTNNSITKMVSSIGKAEKAITKTWLKSQKKKEKNG